MGRGLAAGDYASSAPRSYRLRQLSMVVRAQVSKSPNTEMRELFAAGFGIHHAGMLRQDRLLMEKLFARGLVKVGLEQLGAV